MEIALAGASESRRQSSSRNPPTCCSTCWCCCAPAASTLAQVVRSSSRGTAEEYTARRHFRWRGESRHAQVDDLAAAVALAGQSRAAASGSSRSCRTSAHRTPTLRREARNAARLRICRSCRRGRSSRDPPDSPQAAANPAAAATSNAQRSPHRLPKRPSQRRTRRGASGAPDARIPSIAKALRAQQRALDRVPRRENLPTTARLRARDRPTRVVRPTDRSSARCSGFVERSARPGIGGSSAESCDERTSAMTALRRLDEFRDSLPSRNEVDSSARSSRTPSSLRDDQVEPLIGHRPCGAVRGCSRSCRSIGSRIGGRYDTRTATLTIAANLKHPRAATAAAQRRAIRGTRGSLTAISVR